MKKLIVNTAISDNVIIEDNKFLIYKNANGKICISPTMFTDEELNKISEYNIIELDDKYSNCIGSDFNEDLTFNVEKYNARKQRESNQQELAELQPELDKLTEDLIQAQAGAIIPDLEERKARFQVIHNRIREIKGKEPRKYFS